MGAAACVLFLMTISKQFPPADVMRNQLKLVSEAV
jgi:hypothetical protein